MTGAEIMAAKLLGDNIFQIKGVVHILYPTELNSFIMVMDSGKQYLVEVTECTEED